MRYRQTKFAEPGYIPKIRGYARVSHKSQYDEGKSIADQEARVHAYIKMRSLDDTFGNAVWDKMYVEPRAQSAYSRPFINRPAGRQLWEAIQPGDHIVADKMDRMFRNIYDFCSCERLFAERNVRIHFVAYDGMSLDTGTATGRLMLNFFAVMAEAESDRIAERISLARKMTRARARHQGTGFPFFLRLRGAEGGKARGGGGVLVFKDWALPLMEKIRDAKDHGVGFHTQGVNGIYDILQEKGVKLPADRCDRIRIIRKMYFFYCAWIHAGKPNINAINFAQMISDYRQQLKEEKDE